MDGTKTPGKDRPQPPEPCVDSMTLAAYLDGTLDASQRDACERHFAACAECRQALAELAELLDHESIVIPSAVRTRAKKLVTSSKEDEAIHNVENA
jgi:anti-sigma factor RsiW